MANEALATRTAVPLSGSKRQIVDRLKRLGRAQHPAELAAPMGLTEAAVRQHLDGLATAGLVERRSRPPVGRGRPSGAWALTDLAAELFPDRHADLTVDLIESVRAALGQAGVDKVIAERTRRQALRRVLAALPRSPAPLRARASRRWPGSRAAEGYVAEVVGDGPDGDGLDPASWSTIARSARPPRHARTCAAQNWSCSGRFSATTSR